MRTTLNLDDQLITSLQLRHPDYSKTEAIELAVREYLNHSAVDELRKLAGTMEIEDVSAEMRQADRHV